jgi:prolyl oligopeptidase
MALPSARIETVYDTYFGTTIADPYRWLEDWRSDEAMAWLNAHAAHARGYLDALPHRAELMARITELSDATPQLSGFKIAGGRTFYLRRDPGQEQDRLVVRRAADVPEQTLFDPNAIKGEAPTAIDWFYPSRDGRQVAYGISPGGSEDSTLYVLEVDTGRTLDLAITRTQYCFVSWLEDHQSFVYRRFPERPADAPLTERYFDSRIYLHRLGSDPERDPIVFGRGVNHQADIAREDFPLIVTSPVSDWMGGIVAHGVLSELTLYIAPCAALHGDPATIPWVKVADVDDAVTSGDLAGDTIYLLTHKDAPRYKVVATSASAPDLRHAQLIVPHSTSVIQDMRVVGDALLTRDLDGGIGRIRRFRRDGGEPEMVRLPFDGTISELACEPGASQVLLPMTSWTVSPRVYRYDSRAGMLNDTDWLPPSPIDFDDIEAHEVHAPGKDGTPIPLSIIHRKGLKRDGSNPTLLMGYGSYGISITPFFWQQMRAWYERGGVLAVAHIRGGGEYGKEWHEAGRKLTKQNTIDDFIACGEYLIAEGYTRPERLAGTGTSAGGIPSGGALVQRPDLWAAMIIRVGVTNMLRFEQSENGPPNVPEFGSVTTEAGFGGLQIMDAYGKVRHGVPYPAVMLTTGLNDPRVVAWQATKTAARLMAATSSDKPVLLRAEFQGGHGMGATRSQEDAELADMLAFLLNQFGI